MNRRLDRWWSCTMDGSFTACIIIRSSTNLTTNTTPDSKNIIIGSSNISAFYIIINSPGLIVLFLAFIRLVKITIKITVTQSRLCFDRKRMTVLLIIAEFRASPFHALTMCRCVGSGLHPGVHFHVEYIDPHLLHFPYYTTH